MPILILGGGLSMQRIEVKEPKRDVLLFWYKRRLKRCVVLEKWYETGEWWLGESRRVTYRVLAQTKEIYEISWYEGAWFLDKCYD